MQIEHAIQQIKARVERPLGTNLIYLCFPITYTPHDPARQVADAIGVEPVSAMGLLVERVGSRWDNLLAAQAEGRLQPIAAALAQLLLQRVTAAPATVLCDTEALYELPDLNLTAFLYPPSGEHVIVVSVKASPVAGGLRLLGDGPVYPTGNCTVLEISHEA